jgi:tetratricopeptide (TPR) repeat protein
MRPLHGAIIVLALGYLTFILFAEARAAYSAEKVDQSKVVLLFGSVVLVAIVAGVLAATAIVPAIGEWIGNFFFNPDEEPEKSPHADALAAEARGDYKAALEEYRHAFEQDPADTLAISEVVRLACDKLHDCTLATSILEDALQRDWAPEQAAFLSSRLVDVYWNHLHDARRARELLLQIIETLPDSKYSANAQHRLREIEHRLASEV